MKLSYMIGFQEHDLRSLKMISYHTVYPIKDTGYLYAKSYNTKTSQYEGYQYGYYERIGETENPFEGWEPLIYKHWIVNDCDLTYMHEAYTPDNQLVKRDIRVIWYDIPDLLKYYWSLEKIDIINHLIQSQYSHHINFQFYVNGNISIEFFSDSWGYKLTKDSFYHHGLLTQNQVEYITQDIFTDFSYSIKFKWDSNGKISEKFYVQDVRNWQWI
jgi:hypothetical protein